LAHRYSTPSFGLLVDRRFQRRGIGTRMTEFTISDAVALRCPQVRLSVYASNNVALHIYESLGFEEQAREPVLVMDQPDERIVMLKDLGAARD
jgi:ribosomal protein S18 acetylase RimI-like enzyme